MTTRGATLNPATIQTEINGLRTDLAEAREAAGRPRVSLEDLQLLYAKLAGQLARGFGEVETQLRVTRRAEAGTIAGSLQIGLYLGQGPIKPTHMRHRGIGRRQLARPGASARPPAR